MGPPGSLTFSEVRFLFVLHDCVVLLPNSVYSGGECFEIQDRTEQNRTEKKRKKKRGEYSYAYSCIIHMEFMNGIYFMASVLRGVFPASGECGDRGHNADGRSMEQNRRRSTSFMVRSTVIYTYRVVLLSSSLAILGSSLCLV